MPIRRTNDAVTQMPLSLPMVALLVTLFGYTGYIATQLGGVQQQVITSTKTLDETKAATERLSLESRATASVLASESRATTEKLASETKAATGLLAAESRAATEKLAFEAAAKAAALAAADTILRERVTKLETEMYALIDGHGHIGTAAAAAAAAASR